MPGWLITLNTASPHQTGVFPMRDDPVITDLVTRASNGDRQAWEAIVERYAPLIWSICRRYRLGGADAEDVGQAVWTHLVEHLGNLRDPAALPGWLTTTTRRECCRVLRATGKLPADWQELENMPDEQTLTAEHELLVAERDSALREAFSRLPLDYQRLLALLIADPPMPYTEISAKLGIPVGSIGPTRRRSLDRLRRDPAIACLIDAEAAGH
jgi:RNA polymerase sigma factor (sigma-70 family)